MVEFKNGDFLKAAELEAQIKEILSNIRSKVLNLIPKGSLTSYVFNAMKTFSYKPYSNTPFYDTKSKDAPLIPSLIAYYLRSPWNLNLLEALGVKSNVSFTGLTDSYQKGDVFPYSPLTDLVNNIPLKGNSPVIYNGYLGFSNNCQDTNIITYPSVDGQSLVVKARRLSLLHRWTSSSDFSITDDFLNSTPNRQNLEWKHIDNLDITVNYNSTFNSTVSGFTPSKVNNKDYAVWAVYSPPLNRILLALTPWDANFPAIDGIVNNIYTSSTPSYFNTSVGADFKYIRCLACVYVNSDGFFVSSKEKAWGEIENNTLNGDSAYTKLYQQDDSLNTVLRNQTNSLDRRLVPSYYYMEDKNANIHNRVNYSGIIRNIPSSGSNQLVINCDGLNFDVKINTLELSNNISSVFISNINKSVNKNDIDTDRFGKLLNYTGSSSFYIWFAANPYSVLEQNIDNYDASTTQSGFMTKSNLQLKMFLSPSDKWSGIDSTFKTNELKGFDWRCRVGWLRSSKNPNASPSSVYVPTSFTLQDSKITLHTYPTLITSTTSSVFLGNSDRLVFETVSTATVSTQVPNLSRICPTVNCNTTNSTASLVEGIFWSVFPTSSSVISGLTNGIVAADYIGDSINKFNPGAIVMQTNSTHYNLYKGSFSGNINLPVPSTNSAIIYQHHAPADSIGYIQFLSFYLDQGAF